MVRGGTPERHGVGDGPGVSGFGHSHGDCFDLTPTKLRFWHRQPGDPLELLRAAGLTVRKNGRFGFWHVTGPGIERARGEYAGSGPIWTALSGQPSRYD